MRHKLIFALLVVYGLLVLYVTVTLAAGGSVPGIFVPICTLTGFSFCLLHAVERLGWKNALFLPATRNRPSVKEAGSDRLVIAAFNRLRERYQCADRQPGRPGPGRVLRPDTLGTAGLDAYRQK